MQRKVDIFAQIIQFIFGPTIQVMKTNDYLVKTAFDMIEKWQQLSESMTFMLEVSPDRISLNLNFYYFLIFSRLNVFWLDLN